MHETIKFFGYESCVYDIVIKFMIIKRIEISDQSEVNTTGPIVTNLTNHNR